MPAYSKHKQPRPTRIGTDVMCLASRERLLPTASQRNSEVARQRKPYQTLAKTSHTNRNHVARPRESLRRCFELVCHAKRRLKNRKSIFQNWDSPKLGPRLSRAVIMHLTHRSMCPGLFRWANSSRALAEVYHNKRIRALH